MRTNPILPVLALALAACAVSDGAPKAASAPASSPPLFTTTLPAPSGSVLRVFADPDQLVGWIAGSKSFAGATAHVRIAQVDHEVIVGPDNTFAFPVRVATATEAVVAVGALVQRVTVEPRSALEPTAYFVIDRGAYRPGQKLSFAGFLRRLDSSGAFQPIANTAVEVRVVSETKQTTAAKLAVTSDASGRITGEYTFSVADPLDVYSISIPKYRGTARVTLAEFRKSKVKLEVDATVADRAAAVRFHALDFLDKPVPGGRVSFTAQIVREDEVAPSAFASNDFAYGAPISQSTGRMVAAEAKGSLELDAKGGGSYRVPLKSEFLRGHHRLVVDATIVDANGREQRVTRSIPLARHDVQVQLATEHDIVAAGSSLAVSAHVVDGSGRTVPATTSVSAVRIEPVVPMMSYGYYGNSWNGNNIVIDNGPNGGLRVPSCFYTNMGCRHLSRRAPAPLTYSTPPETLAASAVVVGGKVALELDDPGAYRLIASAKLADGSSVWSELGVAVREREALPALVVELDRDEVRQGEAITGRVQGKFRDAAALVVVRDANGIAARRRVLLASGQARFELPSDKLGYGAVVEAFILGTDREIEAAQELLHVVPKTLSIKTTAKDSYGPGEAVDLDIAIDRAEPVDLVVSVYDQGLLGMAPDRSVDPASFFLADDRLRNRVALGAIRARLGDVTIESVLADARVIAKHLDSRNSDEMAQRSEAAQLIAIFDSGDNLGIYQVTALLRFAGIEVSNPAGYSAWSIPVGSRKDLLRKRVIDFLETDAKQLVFQRIADSVAIGDPAAPTAKAHDVNLASYATGNASFSVQAPVLAVPTPIDANAGGAGEVVRRDFSDSAFWSATTRTGADGKVRVHFQLPDSLTNWQVVVTAVGRDLHLGRAISRLRTVREVMVWPMLPRAFTEGDIVSISASVHNLGAADRDIVVSLRTEHADILSPATITVHVPHGGNLPVTWSVRAKEPGLASLLVSATTNGVPADASLKRIPIVPSSADQVVTASGFTDHSLTVELPTGIDPRTASLEVTFAPSLAADMASTLDYLVEYPYGCAEQTMSRFAPAIRVAGVLGNLGVRDSALAARLPKVVDGGMKRLAELQQPDGGWAWNGHAETHEMITPYVVWGLIQAEKAGYAMTDERVIPRGLTRIRELVETRTGEAQLSDRTYLMYVYSQRERLPDAWWSSLVERRDKLSDYALALALEMAISRGDRTTADRMVVALRDRGTRSGGWTHWNTGSFSRWMEDPFETTAVALDALVAYDATDPLIPEVIAYFVANKTGDRWNSTKATAMVLYAMTDYLAKRGVKSGGRDAFVDYQVNAGTTAHLAFSDGLVRKTTLDGAHLDRSNVIAFPKASAGMMARAVLRYRKSGRDLKAAAQGLEVTRALYLLDAKGQRGKLLATGDRVPQGSYVESIVTVTHMQNQVMRYLLVEDAKPAGAEALPVDDPRFSQVARTWVLREDRESVIAFHHEQAPATTSVRSILHLEMAGELAIPPAQAELMYQTQTRGNSGSLVLHVD